MSAPGARGIACRDGTQETSDEQARLVSLGRRGISAEETGVEGEKQMSYTTQDFSESISAVSIKPDEIAAVVSAWGMGDGMGEDAGHYKWSPDGATDWSGGFLLRLKDETFVYVTGWCDYTGWGCQDGAFIYRFPILPSLEQINAAVAADNDNYSAAPVASEWDEQPADLNRWIADHRES